MGSVNPLHAPQSKTDAVSGNKLRRAIGGLSAIAILIVFYAFVGCPIRYLTGIPCMGCGMTRAFLCAIRLDFPSAFYYHPLWPVPPIFLLLYWLVKPRYPKIYRALLGIVIAMFAAVYIVRQHMGSPIVSIHIDSGLLYRIFQYFTG